MEKTKDYEIEVDGIKRVFRFHPLKWGQIAEMRDAVNAVALPNGHVVDRLFDAIIGTIELLGADGNSLGICKREELEALLNPYAMYDLVCSAVEYHETFCTAYPKSHNLISVVKSFICAESLE